jgi:hypothetical protein
VKGTQFATTGTDLSDLFLWAGLALALGGLAIVFGGNPDAAEERRPTA